MKTEYTPSLISEKMAAAANSDSDVEWSDDDLFEQLASDYQPTNVLNRQIDFASHNSTTNDSNEHEEEEDRATPTPSESDSEGSADDTTTMDVDEEDTTSDSDIYGNEALRDTLKMLDELDIPQFDFVANETVHCQPPFSPKRPVGPHHELPVTATPIQYFELYYTEELLTKVSVKLEM